MIFIDFTPNLFYLDELFCFQLFNAASLSCSFFLNLCLSILSLNTQTDIIHGILVFNGLPLWLSW